jgi:hypothetical protein
VPALSADPDGGYPGYRVVRELEPLGDVRRLVAIDLGLERSVEIHALTGEAATPERVAEFRRRAGVLARLNHPGIAPVHRIEAGANGGVHYVVPHLPEDSLASRLAGGPLPHASAVQLANDLLPALVAAHVAGVVGGELDPATIACVDGRWVTTGLGIRRSVPGSRWVAPEEHGGGAATAAADVFVAGQLLREAFGPASRRIAPVLARATAAAPADRWLDAATLRAACRHATRRRRWKAPALAALGVVIAYWVVARIAGIWPYAGPPAPLYRLAVVPFVTGTNEPASIARNLATVIQLDLDGVPGLRLASARWVLKQLGKDSTGDAVAPEQVTRAMVHRLRTEWVAHGRVDRGDQSVRVSVTLYDQDGTEKGLEEISGTVDDIATLGDTLARRVLAVVAPGRVARYVPRPELQGVSFAALKSFLRGEEAFGQDEHARAAGFYADALKADSTFALAAWRLANVQRWRRLPSKVDLPALYRHAGQRLGRTDRRLLEALVEPDLTRRFAILDSVVSEDPDDAYAKLIYGEELWHRGPLVGQDVTEALAMMASAVSTDSALSQAYDHIIMYHIREGDRRAAWQAFAQKARVTLPRSPGDLDTRRFLRLALYERFSPWLASLARLRLRRWHDSTDIAGLARVTRLATPWLDIPRTQTRLSRILLAIGPPADSARGSARVGLAVGLLAQGKVARGLAQLDKAAGALPTAEMRLQQAEWRLIPPALGFHGWNAGDPGPWLAQLKALRADSTVAARARWALALGRLGTGDTAVFLRGVESLPATTDPLDVLLRAIAAGVRRRYDEAVAIADSARQAINVTQPPDPFAPAALHLFEGDWERSRRHPRAADGDWLWYLAAEFDGWPSGPPLAGEVDGVLGMLARRKRAELRLATATGGADTVAACATIRRLTELWEDADTSLAWVAAGATGLEKGCRR